MISDLSILRGIQALFSLVLSFKVIYPQDGIYSLLCYCRFRQMTFHNLFSYRSASGLTLIVGQQLENSRIPKKISYITLVGGKEDDGNISIPKGEPRATNRLKF